MSDKTKRELRPVAMVIMDGVGFSKTGVGDAVSAAHMPVLRRLLNDCPNTRLRAHGEAVGLPGDDDMGNSEVGHNALGCGQIYAQGAKLVNLSISTGAIFDGPVWKELVCGLPKDKTLHFIGLLSDGNVHSNISHLFAMLERAKADGAGRARVHILLDGRDVPATSALLYVNMLEEKLAALNGPGFDGRIASGGGRMKITMDRYQADWKMVERGWNTHVLGQGPEFLSAAEAVGALREQNPGVIDQDLPPFVIAGQNGPVGKMESGDSVILFNFRGDRAIEISTAFEYENFDKFDRGERPLVKFAGMLQYDGDLLLPEKYLVAPPAIQNTLSELLISRGIAQYAVSETQKYGHVTYFWNGNRSGKFSNELETFEEIPSDTVPFDQRPWMKCAQITDKMIEAVASGKYGFMRCNFPNGDMVGHTGNFDAAVTAMGALDLCLGRLEKACIKHGVALILTADHGNADEMLEKNKKGGLEMKTAHSLNPVPFILCNSEPQAGLKTDPSLGLANCAATVAQLLGIAPHESWEQSILI